MSTLVMDQKENTFSFSPLAFSVFGASVYAVFIWTVTAIVAPPRGESLSAFHRILEMLGGRLPLGIIQILTLFFFLYGLFTLIDHRQKLRKEWDAFKMNLLPVGEQRVLRPDAVNTIKLEMIELERAGYSLLLVSLIKRVCTQYRNENSIADSLKVLDAQIETSQENQQTQYGILDYLSPGLSSLGFLGTVLGISTAIGKFNLAGTDEGLQRICADLYVAFDTTFFALTLGIILSYFFNRVQEEDKKLYAEMKSYIIENLISRIYPEKV
jgi:hypothetical protein